MKNLFALILSAIVFIACNEGYSVKGTIATEVLDGRNVYIKRNIDNTFVIIDSCKITHSTFELTGKADSSHMVALYIDDTPIIPFVAERGRMEIDIQEAGVTIKGTPLNDKLNSLMREQAELEKRMNRFERIETAMILEGSTAEAAQAYVSDSIDAIGAAMEMLMNGYIRKNFDNVLGPCIFALMYSAMPIPLMNDELESLYNDAPVTFRNDAFVKKFYNVARENARRLENGTLQQSFLE